MRSLAEITEGASHATPLIADTLRRFSSAAMPSGATEFAQMGRQAMNEGPFAPAVILRFYGSNRTDGHEARRPNDRRGADHRRGSGEDEASPSDIGNNQVTLLRRRAGEIPLRCR
jgi:hypothetical protein